VTAQLLGPSVDAGKPKRPVKASAPAGA